MSSEDYLKDISEIKNLMDKSSRFISLSGLSGILAGLYALIGAAYAYFITLDESSASTRGELVLGKILDENGYLLLDSELFQIIIIDLVLITFFSVATGILLTWRKSKNQNVNFWGASSKRLLINFLVPLVAGGIYILIIMTQQQYGQIAALMLLFYGLSLLNASKYTLGDIKYLGYTEIVLGLICALLPGYGFWLLVIGFGCMHIIYGTLMYFKYEKS
jgi:hypothetical protein